MCISTVTVSAPASKLANATKYWGVGPWRSIAIMAKVTWTLHRSLSCLPLLLAVFFVEQATSMRYEKGEEVWKSRGEKERDGGIS